METMKPRVILLKELEKHWQLLIKNIPKNKTYEYLDLRGAKECNGIFSDLQYVLFDGSGYGLGIDSRDGCTKMFVVGYPSIDELTADQLSLISAKNNIDRFSFDCIRFSDSFYLFGKNKDTLYYAK